MADNRQVRMPLEMQRKLEQGRELMQKNVPPAMQNKVKFADVLRAYAGAIDPYKIIMDKEKDKQFVNNLIKGKKP